MLPTPPPPFPVLKQREHSKVNVYNFDLQRAKKYKGVKEVFLSRYTLYFLHGSNYTCTLFAVYLILPLADNFCRLQVPMSVSIEKSYAIMGTFILR